MHQRFNVFLFQIWYHISIVKSTYTSCFSIPALSTQESSAVQIWAAKSLPGGKGFDFLPSQFILHNLVHPEGYINSLILSGKFSNFKPISWGVFPEKWVKFLGYERLAVILFLYNFYGELQIVCCLPKHSVTEGILMSNFFAIIWDYQDCHSLASFGNIELRYVN